MTWVVAVLASAIVLAVVVYFGLPALLRAMGLHPPYTIPAFDLSGKRALIVCTSHDRMDPMPDKTGAFGSEFTVPYYAFLDAGMDVDLASIKGGRIPLQPWSWSWPLARHDDKRFAKDRVALQKMNDAIAIADVDPERYDVIFIAGGWGAAKDLMQSEALADVITRANASGKILGSVCHGALGLCTAQGVDGGPLVKDRRVTGVTNDQIHAFGVAVTPKHPETELKKAGAIFECTHAWRDPFATHTTVDGNLVTGQNQNSGAETSHRILEILASK